MFRGAGDKPRRYVDLPDRDEKCGLKPLGIAHPAKVGFDNRAMQPVTLSSLSATAIVVAVLHTLAGPDHYVPFIAMSRAGRWSLSKTLWITAACGVGHVLGSIVLGAIGIGLAWVTLDQIAWMEARRGQWAGWLLLGFGLAYAAWGLRRAYRHKPHSHAHVHADGTLHAHQHVHQHDHVHVHAEPSSPSMTPWVLFTLFVFGPCEPLIPVLMVPAAEASVWGVVGVTALFAAATIGTMLAVVTAGSLGLGRLAFPRLERNMHTLAGLTVAACGAAINLGL